MKYPERLVSLAVATLLLLVTPAPGQWEPDAPPIRIVAVGDATAAPRAGVEKVYVDRLVEGLGEYEIPATAVNAAFPECTTADARQRLHRDVLARDPDLVIIQLGLNDAMVDVNEGATAPRIPVEDYERNIREIIAILHEEGIAVILLTPTPVLWTDQRLDRFGVAPYDPESRFGFNVVLEQYVKAAWLVASGTRLRYVDLYTWLKRLDRRPALDLDNLLIDGMHPNDEGHDAIARNLLDVVIQMKVNQAFHRAPRGPGNPGDPISLVHRGQGLAVEGHWTQHDEYVESSGENRPLFARRGIRAIDDFLVTARLRIDGDGGAAFFMEDDVFGFDDGGDGEPALFLEGPRFGAYRPLGNTADVYDRGAWIDLEAERRGGTILLRIDGRTVHAQRNFGGEIERLGFRPGAGTMQISSFAIRAPETTPLPRRGWTIPTIDLAEETSRRIVVDREPGQYLGHPTTVLLEDGRTIIAVYPKGHGHGPIVMKRSTDGGLTWSERLPVPESWATSQEVPTIHRTIHPGDGSRRLVVFSGLFPIRRALSVDDGLTWTPLEPVGNFGGIVAMASVERLANGDYLALFHDDGRFIRSRGRTDGAMTLYATSSSDGGISWSDPTSLNRSEDVHLCEPGLVRSPDGQEIALLLRENRRRRNSHVMFSGDEGRNWLGPDELPGGLTGDRHVAKYAPDGRLFITFRDTALDSPTRGDWVGWVGTYDDLVHGREGQYRVRLMNNHHAWDCGYPAVELLPDGTFVLTSYGHWTPGEEPYIVSVRFMLEELDAKVLDLPTGE